MEKTILSRSRQRGGEHIRKVRSILKGTKGTMYFLSVVVYFYNKLTIMFIEVCWTGFSYIIIKGNINYGIKYNCPNHKQCHQIPVSVNMYFSFMDNSIITASCSKKKKSDEAGTSSLNGRGLKVC